MKKSLFVLLALGLLNTPVVFAEDDALPEIDVTEEAAPAALDENASAEAAPPDAAPAITD